MSPLLRPVTRSSVASALCKIPAIGDTATRSHSRRPLRVTSARQRRLCALVCVRCGTCVLVGRMPFASFALITANICICAPAISKVSTCCNHASYGYCICIHRSLIFCIHNGDNFTLVWLSMKTFYCNYFTSRTPWHTLSSDCLTRSPSLATPHCANLLIPLYLLPLVALNCELSPTSLTILLLSLSFSLCP